MFLLIRTLSFIFTKLPPQISLTLGRLLGRVYYCFDKRHREIAYHNLRLALSNRFGPDDLRRILKTYYFNMAQNLVEILYMPKINSAYIKKYIKIEGEDLLRKLVVQSKGVILTSAHFGNWEMLNIVCKYLFPDKPYFVLAREQLKNKGLDTLLNSYRQGHGFEVIRSTTDGLRKALANLRQGGLLGMVIDHGSGRSGIYIDFFGHRVVAPTGAVKLCSQFGAPLVLTYIRRIKGPYLELNILPPLGLKKNSDDIIQIQDNVQELNRTVERFISQYPEDYLWQFKRFKKRTDRLIVILSDSKTGHLRQAEAAAKVLSDNLKEKGLSVRTEVINVGFKSEFDKFLMAIILKVLRFDGGFRYARRIFSKDLFKELWSLCPDFVVSAGRSLVALNLMLAHENEAKSIVIMKPHYFCARDFDLVLASRHDRIKKATNVVEICGAANLINDDYLREKSALLLSQISIDINPQRLKIGLLLGGNRKDIKLSRELVEKLGDDITSIAQKYNAQILISTSRRTPPDIEALLKAKFSDNNLCKALIIANENNIPEAVGGILGLCQIIIVSADSISMVSEAASSGKYVVVLNPGQRRKFKRSRHREFLLNLAKNKYIYINDSHIDSLLEELWLRQPAVKRLDDSKLIKEAVERLL